MKELLSINNLTIFRMKTYLLSLFVFICISNVNATNYVVSGAGTTEVNGTYVESGTYNGVPYYQYVNGATTYSLVYDGYGSWFIVDGTDNCYPNGCWSNSWYTNNSNASTPPTSSWYADIMSFGNAPYPSVQIEAPLITYSSTSFLESSNNDGSISNNSITITYNKYGGDALSGSNGEDFLSSGKATLTHLPTGLTATLIRNNDGALTFTVSGNASSHLHADNINNLNLQFYNSAFVGGDASIVVNALQAMTITFIQSWTVASTGADFSTITSAVTSSSVLNYDILLLAAETFTEENIIVNKSLIFKGQGAGSTIIQANATYNTATHLVFNIGGNLTYVKFYDLTIQNGNNIKLTGSDPEYGGGIYSSSPLSLYNCVIKNNINNIYGGVGSGGGVYAGSTLLMNGCLIYGNLSTTTNTVTQNEIGGGVYVDSACTIINSTFSGNTATGALGRGGGLCLASGNHIITNCTFTGNTAGKDGGGIYYLGSESATITNTIIYGNTSTNNLYKDLSFGTLNGLYSIVGTMNSGAINGTSTNVSNADPMLNSLADNGGPTETISLQSGSPAIDAGTSTGAPALDQRGYGRNGATDIGAFEYGGTTSCSTIAPTGTASQSFCSAASPTVADLAATGTAIQWYAASSGGAALGTTDALTNATHYFATQTIGCESSNRLDVTVTVNSTPSASITGSNAFLSGDSVLFTTTTNASTPSYLWSNAKTSSTIWVKTSGNYSVTITDGSTGCSKSATKSITAVTIGNTSLLASYCPFTVAALNSYIYCKSVLGGVTKYQYELKNTNLAYCDSAESGSSSTAISLSQFSGLHYATTYDVRVRAYKSGVWGKFSSVCQITTPSVPNTGLNSISCGATVAALNSYVYCTSVSGATNYQYEITDTARNRVDTITVGGTQLAIPLSRLPIVNYATTYRVRVRAQKGAVWGAFTGVCRVTTPSIPNTGLKSISCGLTVAALNSYVYCSSVSGATDYQYEFTDSVRNTIDTISAGGPQLAISLSRLPIVHYATTYRVRVRAQHGGNWGAFTGVCRVTTPSIPSTSLATCNSNVANTSSNIYCNSVPGATDYSYEISNTMLGYSDTIAKNANNTSISLSSFTGLQTGETYNVRVRVFKTPDWGPFGSVCTFHIGSSGRFGHDQATGVLADVKETEIKVYPNPFNESFIILSNSSTSVNVKIIDQFGRLCQKYTLTGNTSHRIGEGLASGLYMVEAITGEERKIFKVVKME